MLALLLLLLLFLFVLTCTFEVNSKFYLPIHCSPQRSKRLWGIDTDTKNIYPNLTNCGWGDSYAAYTRLLCWGLLVALLARTIAFMRSWML
jgi:hypothetical protein